MYFAWQLFAPDIFESIGKLLESITGVGLNFSFIFRPIPSAVLSIHPFLLIILAFDVLFLFLLAFAFLKPSYNPNSRLHLLLALVLLLPFSLICFAYIPLTYSTTDIPALRALAALEEDNQTSK